MSTGEALVTVLQVVGIDIETAREQLVGAGLLVVENMVADDAPAGTVISQDPAPGTTVTAGWEVALYVSTGPEEPTSP